MTPVLYYSHYGQTKFSSCEYADILLTVPVDSNTFFNSMIGPQFVTEALLEIISHRAKGIEKRLNIIDKYLNKLGNY